MKRKIVFLLIVCSCFMPSALLATMKIMPLGDSITWDWHYGDSRTDAQRNGYRNDLWYKLKASGYNVDFVGSRHNGGAVRPRYDGDNEGYTGWTTYQIADRVYGFLRHSKPNIVLLHIGTNDSMYRSGAAAVEGVESILDEIDRYERNYHVEISVILAYIIQLRKAPGWVNDFNNHLKIMARNRIANGDKLLMVDMYHAVGNNLVDGIHPTSTGYAKMATVWYKAVKKIISKNQYSWLVPVLHSVLF